MAPNEPPNRLSSCTLSVAAATGIAWGELQTRQKLSYCAAHEILSTFATFISRTCVAYLLWFVRTQGKMFAVAFAEKPRRFSPYLISQAEMRQTSAKIKHLRKIGAAMFVPSSRSPDFHHHEQNRSYSFVAFRFSIADGSVDECVR